MTISTILASSSNQYQSVLFFKKYLTPLSCLVYPIFADTPKKSSSFLVIFLFHFKEFTFSIKNHYIESIKIVFSLSFMFSFLFLVYFINFSFSFWFSFSVFVSWFFFCLVFVLFCFLLAKAGVSSSSRYSNVTWQDYYFFLFLNIYF